MLQTSFIYLLLLIIVANASPIIARNLLANKWSFSIDAGMKFIDGQPILGTSKTWRGILASILITSTLGLLLGYSIQTGMLIALLAMSGDLTSSFIKRRLKLLPSSMAPLLDQIPESFLPAFFMMHHFGLDMQHILMLVSVFIVFELTISKFLFQWGIRKRPY